MPGRTKTKRPKVRLGGKKTKKTENHPPLDIATFDNNLLNITPMRPPAPAPSRIVRQSQTPVVETATQTPVSIHHPRVRLVWSGMKDVSFIQIEPEQLNHRGHSKRKRRHEGQDRKSRHRNKNKENDSIRDRNRDHSPDPDSNSMEVNVNVSANDVVENVVVDNDVVPNINMNDAIINNCTDSMQIDIEEVDEIQSYARSTPHGHCQSQWQSNSDREAAINNEIENPIDPVVGEINKTAMQKKEASSILQSSHGQHQSQDQIPVQIETDANVDTNAMEIQEYPETGEANNGVNLPDPGIPALIHSGLQILECMKEQQLCDRQYILKLLEEHSNNFQRQHEHIVSLNESTKLQIQTNQENTTRHIDAVHQSLFDKMQISESRLNELERNKETTDHNLEALSVHVQTTSRQYETLKAAQDEQLNKMNTLSKQLDQVLKRNRSKYPIPDGNENKIHRKKNCPHCNQNFSTTYISAHIKKHCRPAAAAALALNASTTANN